MSGALATPGVQLPPPPEPPEAPEAVPAPGKRPSTRAGRKAAAEARAAAKAAGPVKADTKPRSSGTRSSVKRSDVTKGIDGLHTLAGQVVLPLAGMPVTGQALVEAGPAAGEAWAAAAERYPWIGKAFGTGQDGLVLFQLLLVYAPLIQTALAEKAGTLPPGAPAAGGDLAGLFAMMGAGAAAPGPLAPQPDVPAGQNANGRP